MCDSSKRRIMARLMDKVYIFMSGFLICFLILDAIYTTDSQQIKHTSTDDTLLTLEILEKDERIQYNFQDDAKINSKQDNECDTKNYQSLCSFQTPEDIRTIKLPPFLSNYKNPCWEAKQKDERLPEIRCIPYFFLAGAPKSGTTDLYERIIMHPQVSDNLEKEIHWFSRFHYISDLNDKRYPHLPLFENYTDQFLKADQELFENKDISGYHKKIFGDASVSTFWDNTYAILYSEATGKDVAWTAESIHHLNPRTKFISIVRDPVERVFSDYLYFDRYQNKSKNNFHNGVKAAIEYYQNCLQKHPLRFCISKDEDHIRIWIGVYHGYYEEFFRYFPRKQFSIMTLDEYSANMKGKLAEIFSFLDLDPVSETRMKEMLGKKKENTRKATTLKVGEMLPETKQLLREFYRPCNAKLGQLLGQKFDFNTKYT